MKNALLIRRLAKVIEHTYYEKAIIALIDEVLDENGHVKDNASETLVGDPHEFIPQTK